jgi:hypothetical protein
VKLGRLVQNDEQKRGGQINQVVRIAGSPAINVRERGARALKEIPPLEIAAVREKLLQEDPDLEQGHLVRQLAAVHGVVRKTPQFVRCSSVEFGDRRHSASSVVPSRDAARPRWIAIAKSPCNEDAPWLLIGD